MLVVALALAAAAQTASASTPPASGTQQAFEAAAAAGDRQDWADAHARFEALEAKLAKGKASRSLALVRVRKGEALLGLGRYREAEASVRAGLAALPSADASLREDRVYANIMLGGIAERRFDFAAAERAYTEALSQGAGTSLETRARSGVVRAGTFVDPRAAAATADAALLSVTGTDKSARDLRAQWRTLKGRALLNAGDFTAANAELARATQELGGLTTRVSYSDLVARSDLAIAALLAGKPEKAREYLAYTGAGRFKTGYLPGPFHYPLPACGSETGLRADDVAVVELAMRENGRVAAVTPIYGSRIGVAATLAKSMNDWSWSGDEVAKLPALFRQLTRLEVRCRQTPERTSVVELMQREHDAWTMQGAGADATAGLRDLPLATLRTRFAATGTPVRARLAAARAIEDHPMADRAVLRETARQASTIAKSAPASVLAYWLVSSATLDSFDPAVPQKERAERQGAALDAIAETPTIRAHARTQAAITLLRAEVGPDDDKAVRESKMTAYRRIADMPELPADDPYKVGAKVRLASTLVGDGRNEEARQVYASAGLPAGRCPVLDTGRTMRRTGADSGDFPDAAMQWGFSGWANTESTIGADRATAVRTLVAYPPFVFGPAAQGIARSTRYEPSFRPDAEATCGGQSVTMRFVMADG